MGRRPRLVVVVAHPDDETFGCGSVLADAAARGADCTVVCATRGEGGEPAPGSGIAPADLPRVRAGELADAASVLGVSRVELLGWRDSGFAGDVPDGALVATPVDEVADVLCGLFAQLRPDVIVTLDGSDGHRDHRHLRDATLAAAATVAPTARVYLHCLPRSLMARWADELRGAARGDAYLEVGQLGTPDSQVTTVVDVAVHLDVRERAIAAHRSQTSPFEVMPPDLRRAFLAVDRLRRVQPPWEGGPLEDSLLEPDVAALSR